MIRDSGERTEFETGAVRDLHSGKGRMDLLPWEALVELSKHCEEGALKYGERNCEKGIPLHSLLDSALRHLAKYMMGMDDEPHLRAACWNCLFALQMELTRPELQDIPARMSYGTSTPPINLRLAPDFGEDGAAAGFAERIGKMLCGENAR